MSDLREGSVERDTTQLPGGALGQAGPFLLLALGALWLRARWDDLPARLPVHWNWRGDADRFVSHTVSAASMPLLLGFGLCLFLLCLQLGIRRGAPRGAMRPFSLRLALAAEYFGAFACCGVLAVSVSGGKLLVPLLVLSVAGTAALLVFTVVVARKTQPAPLRNPAAWRGVVYVDREDPALFVPKRRGYGYTLNFGNPLAGAMIVALLALPLLFGVFALSAR